MSQPVTIEFDSPLNEEGSWGSRPVADKAHSTMTFHPSQDTERVRRGEIEWETDQGHYVSIGIWTEGDVLADYDGTMSLPAQAIELLEKVGISVPEDFRD